MAKQAESHRKRGYYPEKINEFVQISVEYIKIQSIF